MKIAISDFDGTLSRINANNTLGSYVSEENIEAIKRWRAAGNKFGIASGRGLNLIEIEIERFHLPFDFLISTNGAAIFDENKNVIDKTIIPKRILPELFALPIFKNEKIPLIVFCERQVYAIRLYPDMPETFTPLMTVDEAVSRDDVLQLGMKFNTNEEPRKAMAEINKKFPMLGGNPNRVFLDINMKPVDKKYGVEHLVEKMGWRENQILVIGDDTNDLPMIEHFHGFTVNTAAPFMHKAATKVYDSVAQMLNDNL